MAGDLPELLVPEAAGWREWLERHHAGRAGVWLVLARKGTVRPTDLSYARALEEAICFGWIDGQVRRRDGLTYFVRFTPRRPRSSWTAGNLALAGRLMEQGRMHAAGLAAVERAGAEGRWVPEPDAGPG